MPSNGIVLSSELYASKDWRGADARLQRSLQTVCHGHVWWPGLTSLREQHKFKSPGCMLKNPPDVPEPLVSSSFGHCVDGKSRRKRLSCTSVSAACGNLRSESKRPRSLGRKRRLPNRMPGRYKQGKADPPRRPCAKQSRTRAAALPHPDSGAEHPWLLAAPTVSTKTTRPKPLNRSEPR